MSTTSPTIKLSGISGSLRKNSYNSWLLQNIPDLLPKGMQLQVVNFHTLPLYNADLDKPAKPERPAEVVEFREQLAEADGIIIVSPEYNFSIPGGLKNAFDWGSRGEDSPLLNKPVSLMGVSTGLWGTVKMQLAFLPVFQAMQMPVVQGPEVLIAEAKDKFDASGKLTDEATRKIVQQHLEEFQKLIAAHQEQPVTS